MHDGTIAPAAPRSLQARSCVEPGTRLLRAPSRARADPRLLVAAAGPAPPRSRSETSRSSAA
eukprot:1950647-Prymnesium_polylepis.1